MSGVVVVSVLTSVLGAATPAFASGGAATQLVITVPGPMTSGVPITVTFYAEDADGNLDTSFSGIVTVSGTGGSSYYPGYSQVTLSAGTGTLDFALFAAGPQTLTPSAMSGYLVGVAIPETVNPGPTASLSVSAPSQVGVNQDFSIGVTQLDAAGNVVINGDSLTITSGAPSTFPTTFDTSGRPTGQISAQGPTSIAVDDLANASLDQAISLTVGPAVTATHLQLSYDQNTSIAGATRQLTIQAVDGNSNVQTLGESMTLTSTDARAVINRGNPTVDLVNGTATVPVVFETAADQAVTADEGGSISGISPAVSVDAGWISTLQVDAPATVPAGTEFTGKISGVDSYGNQSLASTGIVTLSWSSSADPTDPTTATYVHGIATFTGSFTTAGPGSVTVSGPNFWDPTGAASITITASGNAPAGAVPVVSDRISGPDRVATATAVSAKEFPSGGASAVVLARSDDAADSTVGTVLAAAKNAPLLLTTGETLPAVTATEIARVIPAGGTVYVLGGTSAIPAAVATQLTGRGYAVVRLAGSDRYSTAVAVADATGGSGAVFLATGNDFADALVAGPAAAHDNGVVLLTDGAVMPPAVRAYLAAHHGSVIAVGGHAVAADRAATAIAGSDRYSTAAMIAARFFSSPTSVGVASGTTFADGLSGGAYLAHLDGPLLLTASDSLSKPVTNYLASMRSTTRTALTFGGGAAIDDDTMAEIDTALVS